jgi:hypothetical protein
MYGQYYLKRYSHLASIIPSNVSVTDLCCGDSSLYHYALKGKNRYTGMDINPLYNVNDQNCKIIKADILKDPIPISDYVIIQGSLYQFIPNHKEIINKMLDSARYKVIISEPVINLVNSKNKIISTIAKYSANPSTGNKKFRFTKSLLNKFFRKNYKDLIENTSFAAGGRDMLFILRAK